MSHQLKKKQSDSESSKRLEPSVRSDRARYLAQSRFFCVFITSPIIIMLMIKWPFVIHLRNEPSIKFLVVVEASRPSTMKIFDNFLTLLFLGSPTCISSCANRKKPEISSFSPRHSDACTKSNWLWLWKGDVKWFRNVDQELYGEMGNVCNSFFSLSPSSSAEEYREDTRKCVERSPEVAHH